MAYDIVLEITRKCNLRCDHCLRGPAQNKSIQDNVLNFVGREKIGNLFITGGEPTLVKDIFTRFVKYSIFPDSVSVVTNGKVFKSDWAKQYFRFSNMLTCSDESQFGVSTDCFHDKIVSDLNLRKYEELSEKCGFIGDIGNHNNYLSYDGLLCEGNAFDFGGRDLMSISSEWEEDEIIYIAVNGDVLLGCNWSYNRMPHLKIGNITVNSLSIILENRKKHFKLYNRIAKIDYNKLKRRPS